MALQYVDPEVSRSKFDREIAEYRALGADYRARGWFLVHADFPRVLVVMAAPQLKPAAIVTGVALDYTNYDQLPPSVQLVNPFTGVPFKRKELPTALPRLVEGQAVQLPGGPAGMQMIVNQAQDLMQAHTPEDVPFLCLAGTREYHQHPAHGGDAWELHRTTGAGRLVRLLDIVHRHGVLPITAWGVNLVPQVGFNLGPPAR